MPSLGSGISSPLRRPYGTAPLYGGGYYTEDISNQVHRKLKVLYEVTAGVFKGKRTQYYKFSLTVTLRVHPLFRSGIGKRWYVVHTLHRGFRAAGANRRMPGRVLGQVYIGP